MESKHNPKDIAITGQEFIQSLLNPSAILPCGDQDPNFYWFDEPEKHINGGHFRLRDELAEIRAWKKRALLRGFTKGLVWEDADFWQGTFLKQWIDGRGDDDFQQGKAQIISHAFANGRLLDMSCVTDRSRTDIERCNNEYDLIKELV